MSIAKLKAMFSNEDEWIDSFDYENLGSIWKEGGAALNGPIAIVNPINATFGKIHTMQNCTFHINIGSFDTASSHGK